MNGTPLVGIVGRIVPIKNHRLFLDAAARTVAKEPAARFVVVGDGILRPEIERFAEDLGIADRVAFTGWRSDVSRIYSDLDVLVISSDNEGTPFTAMEAMASGRPVVGTAVGGMGDLIADGENGYLVPQGDADGLASAVLGLLADPGLASSMGRKGREIARSRFSVQRLISETEELYQHALQAKGVMDVPSPV
jgi:glycosyltransferase involved in cell wall biosynthesis